MKYEKQVSVTNDITVDNKVEATLETTLSGGLGAAIEGIGVSLNTTVKSSITASTNIHTGYSKTEIETINYTNEKDYPELMEVWRLFALIHVTDQTFGILTADPATNREILIPLNHLKFVVTPAKP